MPRRIPLYALMLLPLVLALSPRSALAHGPIRRGFELDYSTTMKIPTGSSSKQTRWLTVGLNPGHFSAVIKLTSCSKIADPTCGVYMALSQPTKVLRFVTAGCRATHPRCGSTARVDLTVTSRGVYYLWIQGSGSSQIEARLTVKGNIYPLHCGSKYC